MVGAHNSKGATPGTVEALRKHGVKNPKRLGTGKFGTAFLVSGADLRALLQSKGIELDMYDREAVMNVMAHNDSRVVLKVQVPRGVSKKIVSVARHEAAALRKLSDPNMPSGVSEHVPRFYASAWDKNKKWYYIAMEFVEGMPIDHLHHISPELTAQIEEVVRKLHAAGFVHADLHEGNIMLTHDNIVKFVDFGAAEMVGDIGMELNSRLMSEMYTALREKGQMRH